MSKKHYVYKCIVQEQFPWPYEITAYTCRDFYLKRLRVAPERRARRVTKDYLQDCFPEWYRNCGMFHVEHSDERG